MDLKYARISNRVILAGMGMALVRRLICEGIAGFFTGIFQISFPIILLYPLFLAGALGAGDIKLISLIGGFVNFKELLGCIVISFLFGAVLSLGKMLIKGIFFSSMRSVFLYLKDLCFGQVKSYCPPYGKMNQIPFSLAIFFGLILSEWINK